MVLMGLVKFENHPDKNNNMKYLTIKNEQRYNTPIL